MAIFSALSGAVAGSQAAQAIKEGNRAAADTQRDMYATNLRLLAPQYTMGQSAMFQLADLYGLDRPADYTTIEDTLAGFDSGPGAQGRGREFFGSNRRELEARLAERRRLPMTDVPADERRAAAMERFYTSPGYTFRLEEGLKALDRSAAARGQMLSGGHLKDMQRFSQGLASSEYGNYVNRLASLAGYGQVATGQATGLGAQTAGNISGLQADTGAARASGYLTTMQGIQSGVQNTMDFVSGNPAMFGLPGG